MLFVVSVNFDIEAESDEEAEQKARDLLKKAGIEPNEVDVDEA